MLLNYIVQGFSSRTLGLSVATVLVVIVAVSWIEPSLLPYHVHATLSRAIHVSLALILPRSSSKLPINVSKVYLCWRFPIKDQTGSRPLPTCPYSWPNGQGDIGKFLEGIENSEIWGKEHGQVYRIWSGMKSEV